jgi:hypothetical protein
MMILVVALLAAATATLAASPPELQWLPNGKHVLVGKRWILNSETGQFRPVSCTIPARCERGDFSISPDGAAAAVLDGANMAIGELPGLLADLPAIPTWLDRDPATLVNVAVWLDPRALFVQQFDVRGGLATNCRIYEVGSRTWSEPSGGCLASEFSYLGQIDRGPGGLFALHSTAEAGFALQFVRYDPTMGQSTATSAKPILLQDASSVTVRFSENGTRVELVTPCRLDGTSPVRCADYDRVPFWRLYSVSVADGTIRLRRTDLPPGAVMNPLKETFVWPRGEGVCVGDPKKPGIRCFAVPR